MSQQVIQEMVSVDLLVEWSEYKLALGNPPMRNLQPSNPTLILLIPLFTYPRSLRAVEQEIEIDDAWTVRECLCTSRRSFDLL